jgi:hypothetical protein
MTLDLVGNIGVCDACGNILPSSDTIPYCDFHCNLLVINKHSKSKKRIMK